MLLGPYLKEDARVSIEDALPRFSTPEPDEAPDERAEGRIVDDMWMGFKMHWKAVKAGLA